MKTYTPDELFNTLQDMTYTHVKVESPSGQSIIAYPSKTSPIKTRLAQMDKFFSSKNIDDGLYIVKTKATGNAEPKIFHVLKEVNGKVELNDAELIDDVQHLHQEQMQTKLITDSDLLELRVLVNSLQMQVEILEAENELLSTEIVELNKTALNDAAIPNKSLFDSLLEIGKELLPTLGDAYFSNKKEENALKARQLDIEQAKIGLAHQAQISPQPQHQARQATLDELLQFKNEHPAEFNQWLGVEENYNYYNKLQNEQ